MFRIRSPRALGAFLTLCLMAASAGSALAGICFTSGKVYVQQKVWDKAAAQLECARKQEPENIQVYLLLASARGELTQYASAGAAFSLGIAAATKKKDDKKVAELKNNQMFYMSRLYNAGVKAMAAAGNIPVEPDSAATTVAFGVPAAPEVAITDTTTYGKFEGASRVEEAVYDFRLATLVDPKAVDAYRNLSYLYEILGRTDDAMAAARAGLAIAPNDEKLARNLRAAAVGQANRLAKAGKHVEAIHAYERAKENDPAGKISFEYQIANMWYQHATSLDEKSPERPAALDSTVAAYKVLLVDTPADSAVIRETAFYNMAVIYANQNKYKEAIVVLDEAVPQFGKSKELISLAGQTKFSANDYAGAVKLLKQAEELDPKDPTIHQFLFLSYNKLGKQDLSVAQYSMYKALSEGKSKTGSALKTWVDSADNRLGPKHMLKKTLASDGYPEEVRTFNDDGGKALESWFYWSKGKVITFMEGQVLSHTEFPPSKT
jgi:tetratricopeptide (TPR) repeat protein